MRLTFIDSACCIIEHSGYRILTDPWLSNGAFEGSWYHYPVLTTKPEDLAGVDAVYISHVHPDHLDATTLAAFRRDIPVIVLDHGKNYLHRLLRGQGFDNLIRIGDAQSVSLGPFTLSAYKPFATDVFHESKIGNVIDSSLALEAGGFSIFNGNDNNLTLDAARGLRERHGQFTAALLKYNAASPYPACFMQLDEAARADAARRVQERNLEHLVPLSALLEPRYLMPFAGNFVLAGKQSVKNRFLATTTWDEAAAYVRRRRPQQKTLLLREGQTFDFSAQQADAPYVPVDVDDQRRFIERVAGVRYPYEAQPQFSAHDGRWFDDALPAARANLWRMQGQLRFAQDYHVYLATGERHFHFRLNDERCDFVDSEATFVKPYLCARMDPRLLKNILQRKAHWNNVEIGCHIDFYRDPDEYFPDLHVMLSFLHLPAAVAEKVA